jgi:LmbE family N-acetylglucosaminyl deacetylase
MTADGEVKRALVIVAHPDDADLHAGGTLARWVDEGYHVHLIVATSGFPLAEGFKRLLPG